MITRLRFFHINFTSVEHFYLANYIANGTGIMYILVDHLGDVDNHLRSVEWVLPDQS